MAVTVRRATLWSVEKANLPGALSGTLAPLAEQKLDLSLVMGYSSPDKKSACIEVYPVSSAKARKAAREAGLATAEFPCVSVEGRNRAGLGHEIAEVLAEAGINLNFFIAQVVGTKYTAMFSFEAESEADMAVKLLRKALAGRSPARRRVGSKPAATSTGHRKTSVSKKRRTGTSRRG